MPRILVKYSWTLKMLRVALRQGEFCKHANVSFKEFFHLIKVFSLQDEERQHDVPLSILQMQT